MITETSCVAFRQSSRERRSPVTISTFLPASTEPSACSRRPIRLGDLTKQNMLEKPYSRRISTTLVPMKPLDPVTKIRSSKDIMYSEFMRGVGNLNRNKQLLKTGNI